MPWDKSRLVSGDTTLDPVDIFFLLLRDLEEELPSDILERDRLEGDSWFPLTAGDSGLDLDLAFFFLVGQEKVERGGEQGRG